MKSSLREQLEQLAQRPAAPQVVSGSPVDLELTMPIGIRIRRPIDAIKALRDCGLTLLEAKIAFESLAQRCSLILHLPGVSDLPALIAYLAECDITAVAVDQHAHA
jgi:hypothetical protein